MNLIQQNVKSLEKEELEELELQQSRERLDSYVALFKQQHDERAKIEATCFFIPLCDKNYTFFIFF
jgi:hypothetical protein